jgi:hypothetical protein
MKKQFSVVVLVLSSLGMVFVGSEVRSARAAGGAAGFPREMAEVTEALMVMSQSLETAQTQGFGLLRSNDFGLYGKFIAPQRQDEVSCWFEKGQEIRVIATGNSAALDVDLRIYEPGGSMLGSDTRDAADASLRFTVPAAGQYRLNLELCQASQDRAFCTLAVLEQNGYVVTEEDLCRLLAKHALGNTLLAARTEAELGSWRFADATSSWPLLGCALDTNSQAKRWSKIDRGSYLVSVFADPNAQDVDVVVCDQGGKRIDEEGPEAHAVIEFEVGEEGDCACLVSVPKATKPTFSLLTVFRSDR